MLDIFSAAATGAAPGWTGFLPIVGMIAIFWFLIIRPQMRQQKAHREKIAAVKKGDQVVVLSGKDKGRTGTVTRVLPKDGKVVVDGINVAARHRKPSQANPQGGIDRAPAPMAISKVAVADPKDGRPTRVRFEEKNGKKVRVAVKSGETIDG